MQCTITRVIPWSMPNMRIEKEIKTSIHPKPMPRQVSQYHKEKKQNKTLNILPKSRPNAQSVFS